MLNKQKKSHRKILHHSFIFKLCNLIKKIENRMNHPMISNCIELSLITKKRVEF